MKIVVLIKHVPDTWGERRLDPTTGRLDRDHSERVVDEIGERAAEVALGYKDRVKDAEVVAMTMGPATAVDAVRRILSMGADAAVHVLDDDLAGADALATARALGAAIRTVAPDLVIAGNESTDSRGGVVPSMIAEVLGWPALTSLDDVEVSAGGVAGWRTSDDARTRLTSALPAVVSVTERAAEPRFPSMKGILGAKRKPLTVLGLADLGRVDDATSIVLSVRERPARGAGRVIVDDGAAADELVRFLIDERLA